MRTWNVAAPKSAAPQAQEMRGPFGRGPQSTTALRAEAGMQRVTWDLRYPGPWTSLNPAGGAGGPMVPPGKYSVRLTAAGQTITRTFTLASDPRVAADGVTDAAIARQTGFSQRTVERRVRHVMERLGAQTRFQAGVQAVHRGWL